MTATPEKDHIYQHEYQQAANAYLMAVVSVIAGLPLPVINIIASLIFYMGHRKSSYFVRWHCIQSVIAQALIIPFNSIAFGWTLKVIISTETSLYYWLYIAFVIMLNLLEFFAVIYTAHKVKNGRNVRWFIAAPLADALTAKENRDPYRI